MAKKFNDEGVRLTDCCGCMSTYDEMGTLVCKGCYNEVSSGEGDGCETKTQVKPSIRTIVKLK